MDNLFDLLSQLWHRQKSQHVLDQSQLKPPGDLISQTSKGGATHEHFVFFDQADSSSLSERSAATLNSAGIEARPTQHFDAINGFSIQLTPFQAETLRQSPGIGSVEADRPMPLMPPVEVSPAEPRGFQNSFPTVQKPSTEAFDTNRPLELSLERFWVENRVDQSEEQARQEQTSSISALPVYGNGTASTGEVLPYGVKAVWRGQDISTKGNAGNGTYAFVIDSGVLNTTGDLKINTSWSKSWISGESAFTDGNGHGTHVAGTIAALANGKGVVGVAPGAEVISLKVFNSSGGGASYTTIISAINHAVNVINSNGLDKTKTVINMSLGGGFSSGLDAAVKNAADQGIKFAIAAGNSGADADGYSPASAGDHANVYTVSAVDNTYRMPSFSNWDDPSGGDDVDVAAPGVSVLSYYRGGNLSYLSGTSMAAPHVAGLLLMGGVKAGDMVTANGAGHSDPFALASNGQPPSPPPAPIKPPKGGLNDDFKGGQTASFWSSISLGSINSNFTGRTDSLFFSGTGTRSATTKAIDLDQGATISFDLVYGTDYNGGEQVDAGEEIVLEYSSDGSSWKELQTYAITDSTRSWGSHTANLSENFATDSTQLRWRQKTHSSSNWDQWAIDNINIKETDLEVIESNGNVHLHKDSSGMGWVKLADGSFDDITAGGQRKGENSYFGWSQRAAETINGVNTLIWTNTDGRMSEWTLDSNWNLSNYAIHSNGSEGFSNAELAFNQDFNNDKLIGRNTTAVESNGNVHLHKDSAGMGWVKLADGSFDDITAGGQRKGEGSYQGWSQRAAESINGTNKLIWTHVSGAMSEWTLDSNWNLSSYAIHSNGSEGFSNAELAFNQDFNNDKLIGRNTTAVESNGNVHLHKDSAGMGWVKLADGSFDDITAGGQRKGEGSYQGWSQRAAESINGTNKLIWTHVSGAMSEWTLDSNWNLSSYAIHSNGSEGFSNAELAFNQDFNNDKLIGRNTTAVESNGNVHLHKDSAGMGWVKLADGSFDDITAGGQRKGEGSYQGWSQRAAESINGTNKLIWTHVSGAMSEWTLDSNWNLSSYAIHSNGSEGFSNAELAFNQDFNNDKLIGRNTTAVESNGNVHLHKDSAGMGWVKLADGSFDDITAGGQRKGEGSYQGWSQRAAESINGTNKLIWTHVSGAMSEWTLDSNWNLSSYAIHSNGSEGFSNAELAFNQDFNNDKLIGRNTTAVESNGNVHLHKDSAGMGWVKLADGSFDDITAGGQRKGEGSYQGWSQRAAESINGTNKLIWTHVSGAMSEWTLDSNWNLSSYAIHSNGSEGFSNAELAFNQDFNNDNIIGNF
ncbi:S8 family serine peptidase [Synechococcus sp. MIT S9451]|uniref:S8 family serine peptidase n=1 Tax=Synechococcus sp. MIT S9451 TaxID=3082543 RepID=UPI0039B4C912